jgi:hypothetical protein
MPREEAIFTVWLDPGITGWAAQNHLSKTVRMRLNIIQGYLIDGGPKPGMFGGYITASPVSRSSVPLSDPARLNGEIASLKDDELALALLQVRVALMPRDKPLSVDQAKALVTAVGDRYRRATATERIVILTLLPSPRVAGAAVDLERVIAQIDETDPAVVRAVLLTRVDEAASPLLTKFRNFNDAGVQEAVKLVDARLANPEARCFARIAFASEQPTAPSKPKGAGDAPPAATPTDADKPAAAPTGTPPTQPPQTNPPATPAPVTPPPSPPSPPK